MKKITTILVCAICTIISASYTNDIYGVIATIMVGSGVIALISELKS